MKIRNMQPHDAAALAMLMHAAVRQIGIRHYTAEQVAAWSSAPMPPQAFLQRVADGRFVFVAVDDKDMPTGFIELERDGHIDCFYCAPEWVGRGVGMALYQHLEMVAREVGLERLRVEASEGAKGFFIRAGFLVEGVEVVERCGVGLRRYLMGRGGWVEGEVFRNRLLIIFHNFCNFLYFSN